MTIDRPEVRNAVDPDTAARLVECFKRFAADDELRVAVLTGAGGKGDDKVGWFVRPTVIETTDPDFKLLKEELFGPILTIYPYADGKFEDTLDLVDRTSPYGLTGAIFARDRQAIRKASETLVNAAGNFYINDKPTGAVVGLQPFGGARASGTNDKAGSILNLIRWTSPRVIKETYAPPTDHRYPFMDAE